MRFLAYIALVGAATGITWRLGMARHGSTGNVLLLAVILVGAAFLLTKRQCLALGVAGLVLGIAGPALVWSYGSLFIKGDPSGYGMLGTLLAFCFVPTGLGLALIGWGKNE